MEKIINFTLKVWRQKGPKAKGAFESYPMENISGDTSFLEMLDILNEKLINEGKEPVVFDHDCREGICGMCSLYINGHPHGPATGATTCQIYMQIYGREVEPMVEAAKIVEAAKPDILDINFGCPVKKVAGKGAGAGMLQNIPKMLEITKAVVDAVNIPVTVKTRLGWDSNSKVIVELAEQLQDCGIAALTIHGRTRSQMYTGEADWTLIGEVKNNPRMHIPIIGNGDITTPQQVKEYFDRYGVDAIMVGRATFGRPWIFKEIKHYLETGEELPPLTFDWKMNVLREQVNQSIDRLDERRGIIHDGN